MAERDVCCSVTCLALLISDSGSDEYPEVEEKPKDGDSERAIDLTEEGK